MSFIRDGYSHESVDRALLAGILFTAGLLITGLVNSCAAPQPWERWQQVPVSEACRSPSAAQKALLEQFGRPDRVWQMDYGVTILAYCPGGRLVRSASFDVDSYLMQMRVARGQGIGSSWLCRKPETVEAKDEATTR